jgi:subtilisin family serine protease
VPLPHLKGLNMDVRAAFLCFLLALSGCGSSTETEETLTKATDDCEGEEVSNQKIIRWKDGRLTKHKLAHLKKDQFKRFVENNKNKIVYIENDFKISKPLPGGVSLLGWGGYPNWGVDMIAAKTLWNQNIFGEDVLVAIIDSGIDTQHPQLLNQLYVNPNEIQNGIDDDGNGLVDDIHGFDFPNQSGNLYDGSGHGTHVAGIVAAGHDTGSIQGVAPKAKLLVFDFFDDDGGGSVFDAIAAIRAAELSGARVINASWGGSSCSRSMREALDELSQKNILFVTAAGNEGLNIDRSPMYPAAFGAASQITVGAMTADGSTAGFSNYGRLVHLMAPGADILSTYPLPYLTAIENGTSMAAPFVAGAAALLWSAFPQATAKQVKEAIVSSAATGPFPVLSRGSLDVAAAHEALKNILNP